MTLFAGEACRDKCPQNIEHQLGADYASTETEDIHVVVLYALMSGIRVVTHGRSYATYLVCRHGNSHSASAGQHSALAAAARDFVSDRSGIVGIIVRLRRIVRAQVNHL